MNKGLDALNKLRYTELCRYPIEDSYGVVYLDDKCDEELNTIEKELKAFDIIDKKAVNVNRVKQIIAKGLPWHTYNLIQDANRHLTEEEYDLLKEVLL